MNQKKVLALLLSLCLIVSMTVPVFAAGSRGVSWPWTSSSATVEEEPATTSGGSLVLVEDETTVTEGTELRASTYVLTNDGSSASAPAENYTAVPSSSRISDLAQSGETYYYLSDGVYHVVTFTQSSFGIFQKWTTYTLTANGKQIAFAYATSTLSSARITLYSKTVSEGTALRASTYTLTNTAGSSSTYDLTGDTTIGGKIIKYFPVTLYNYDDRYNAALHQMECEAADKLDNLTRWNGIYFGGNGHGANVGGNDSYAYTTGGEVSYTSTTVSYSNNNNYNKYINNGYYVDVNGTKYLVTGLSCTRSGSWWNGYTYSWTITYAGGTATSSDSSITLYKASSGSSVSKTLPYANWNKWTGNFEVDGQRQHGNKTYSGLVESNLNNGSIQFTEMEAGIFTNDTTYKDVYTNVQMPFVYDDTTKTYMFDANEDGVYFHTDSTQGTSATPTSNSKLYFTDTPQNHNFSAQDKRTKGWFPFNDASDVTTATGGTADYFFGMQASIPFTMTGNGRLKDNDSTSAPITFSFSGDDDVWVFIDGKLVLDLGGVHNGMNATLNFAENTWDVSEMLTSINGINRSAEDVNNATLSGKIFNEGVSTGTLNQTRETFAATDSHTLTIFYLERGAGSSNCKIQFNLPMKDTLTVTKRATQSISADGTLSPLTATEQATVDNIDFGFTLTKNGTRVANTIYSLLNANGQVIGTPSTDANGQFTLRNGQTAKFIGEIAADGAVYQVVEDAVEGIGFKQPTYTYNGTAAGGFTVSSTSYSEGSAIPATTQNLTSAAVTAKGSTEAEDSLQFICENYFDATLPNPSSRPVDDQIVIDYGLPVIIDALANDVYRGDTIELIGVTGAQYGTATIENGKITYQLTKQLTGVEVLTYTAKVTGSGTEESKTAKVYIIPATSVYYEENFSGLVTFSDGWSDEGTAQTDPQEPGVVGTVSDSPYGSDAAYLNDSGDSNGTSKHVDTTNGSASFSYTFTGTGTSFFARTSVDAAYMKVVITSENKETVKTLLRNNIYKAVDGTDVGTLYNVPVFTEEGLDYGTYTVNVSIAKYTTSDDGKKVVYGKDFYLDGIRVINPLDIYDGNVSIANSAYATDGEANMAVVTLRQKLISEAQMNVDDTISWNEGDNFVLFTDTNGKITAAEEYKSNGPKEEVYLNNDQSVTFSLENWDANTNKIYLGIKAPVGSGTVSINGNTLNINNATDCYYDISGYSNITIDEDGVKTATFEVKATSSLISVTNIKVTGTAEFTIVNSPNKDVG